MRLVILVDNYAINGRNLKGEGGASYYIEDEDKKFLLDVGVSDLFMKNAENLDIDLKDVDTVVLSHGHYDHTTGIKYFIDSKDKKINIICHPLSFNKKKRENKNMGAPYNKEEIEKLANVTFSKEPLKISKNITYLGQIPDTVEFENRKLMGQIEINGEFKDDYILDDSALLYKTKDGIYIITGCSHSGICNIIEYAKKIANDDRVLGIIGGTHLQEINEQTSKTIEYFKENDIRELYPCHCTKFHVRAEMFKTLDIKDAYVGLEVNW
ncbi:MBL fold metallo-hydrolase [Intestinibacter sp.]|uniref:MBL fold metallo-hydrolase n=1 Tax=Intestinibacter sp. TaxID=1965304 RepID=UPI003F177D04